MPQQPATSSALDLTRRCFEAGNSGDFDALMLFFGPDSVWDVSPWGLGSHTGRPAIRAFFGDWIGSLDEYDLQVEELVDLGNGIVLAVANQGGVAAARGAHLRIRWAAVFIWAEDTIVRATHYGSIDEARAAAERLGSAPADLGLEE